MYPSELSLNPPLLPQNSAFRISEIFSSLSEKALRCLGIASIPTINASVTYVNGYDFKPLTKEEIPKKLRIGCMACLEQLCGRS